MSQNTTAMQRGAGGETTGATDMTTQQHEALRLAEQYDHGDPATHGNAWKAAVCAELRLQHARITELEAQLEAVGAGGVGPLIASAGFDAADMATAAAQWFMDGVASINAQAADSAIEGCPELHMGNYDEVDVERLNDWAIRANDEIDRLHALAAGQATAAQQGVAYADAHGAIMGAAYDFRDAHISGSPNQKRSAHAALESAVTHTLRAARGQAPAGANENAELVTLIAECRDAFPIPAHGDPIENYWSAAIEDPANVPAYLQEIAKRKQADSVQGDAARYRFLRDGEWRDTDLEPFIRLQLNTLWDAKIDAARKQGEKQ